MRLIARSRWQLPRWSRQKSLPREQNRTLIPMSIWAVFVASVLLFVGTLFFTSWTSTGPTFLPIEQSSPFSNRSPIQLPFGVNLPAVSNSYLPELLQLPSTPWETLAPLAIVVTLCILTRVVPATNWSRLMVKLLIIGLASRYMVWRTIGNTLNLTTGLSTTFSLWLYAVEVFGFVGLVLTSLQTIWSTAEQRHQQADRYEQQILAGEYLPSVDVFVPTYNEQAFIVRRTVMGCQAMDYPNKKIYILDDSRRPAMRELAAELGCGYITQPEGFVNHHAKAGNLNNGVPRTNGDLIAILDADFVPFKHFLTRTVGFFQQKDVAIVQTPQDFYNPDHHVRNLGVAHLFPNDLQFFFQYDQSTRDAANSVLCCGTSYVIRRQALESIGGYYSRCVAEDSPTSIVLLTQGWRVIYLNEKLSTGESTRNYRDFIKQRLRWQQGNLQIFYCTAEVPLWRKLNWVQKTYMITHWIGCFQPLLRLTYLLSPLVCLYLGVSNYIVSLPEFLYYGAPLLLLTIGTTAWSSHYHTSHFYTEVWDTILCFPGVKCLFSTLRRPFGKGFTVTAKGVTTDRKSYNLRYTYPLILTLLLTVTMLGLHVIGYRMRLWDAVTSPEFGLVFYWLIYNIVIMSIAILAAIDQPERRGHDRFPVRTACRLTWADGSAWGYTHNLSESGVRLSLVTERLIPQNTPIAVEFLDYDCVIPAQLVALQGDNEFLKASLTFTSVSIAQHRHLIEMLYSNMAWWKQSRCVGALDALLSLLSALLRFRPLLSRYDRQPQ